MWGRGSLLPRLYRDNPAVTSDSTRLRALLVRCLVAVPVWLVAALTVNLCVELVRRLGLGWDSHAYWLAWHGPMYDAAPNTVDAYLYSPAFAQAFWPLAQLPWPVACAITVAAPAGALAWLLRPLGAFWAIPLWLIGLAETLSGNIFWLLALCALWGLKHPWLWAVPALTKVTPALGPVWFAVRREWRQLGVSVGATALVVAVSYAISPELWSQWLTFLTDNAGGAGHGLGSAFSLPLVVRLPLALALVVAGALTGRRWLLPVAMVVATPVTSIACWVVLAAIPRIQRDRLQRDQPAPLAARVRDRVQGAANRP